MSVAFRPSLRALMTRLSVTQLARIVIARLYLALGWTGCVGMLCLILASVAWIGLMWPGSAKHAAQYELAPAVFPGNAVVVATPMVRAPALPHAKDSVQILRRIKSVAQANGLNWPQAEYRLVPISEEGLATLEIRTTIKGPYPRLRQLIATLLEKEPALAMRELTLNRPNGDAVDVEAKIRWAVFLADGWLPVEQGVRP